MRPNFYDNGSILSDQGKAITTEGESSMVAADAALQWIDSLDKDQPFLAVIWFGSPHSPHRAAEQDRSLYGDLPKNMQHFLGEITGMDRAFGKVRDGLGERGIRENTILWYCSDNGGLPKVGSTGGRANKGKVYEGGLLVPAILEWPARIRSPRATNVRCNTCDIFPTLMEVTGTELAREVPLDGVSLLPLVDGETKSRDKPMGFWDYPAKGISTPSDKWMTELYEAQQLGKDLPPDASSTKAAELPNPRYSNTEFPGHSALIDGDWKLHQIVDKKGQTKWELYDLANDKMETKNLIAEDSDRAEKLKVELRSWLTSVVGSLNGDDY